MKTIGIEAIASYVPAGRVSNVGLAARFDVDQEFLASKLGVLERAIKAPGEETSDLGYQALLRLMDKAMLAADCIEALVVVTQNPDRNIPHVSAQIHGRAGLSDNCAVFDVSLGCSGYVYGLTILRALMQAQGMSRGVLITADPYSKIIDSNDRNTALLFGDAATATLLSTDPVLTIENPTLKSRGKDWEAIRTEDGKFTMDGRGVFNFAATAVPEDISSMLRGAGFELDEVDLFILHQGSRFIVKTIAGRLRQPAEKFPVSIENYGNTVSSTIPLIVEPVLQDASARNIVLSGFGVGLSWASCLCRRING